jgi:hypothetical protein
MEHQFCRCDPDCYIYKDYCFDSKKPANTSNSEYSSYYICHKGHNSDNYEGFFVEDSCPTGYGNETDTRICSEHKISENGPSVVNPEGVAFKNRHCALCHGVSDVESFDVRFIGVRYKYVYPSRSHNLSDSCLLQRILHSCQSYAPCDRYNKKNIQSYLYWLVSYYQSNNLYICSNLDHNDKTGVP